MTGFTAISPCNQIAGSLGQVPVTALTRRHGYTLGHAMGGFNGFNPNLAGYKVWFCTAGTNIVTMTVSNAITRCGSDCPENPYDYTILVFTGDLPDSITPMSVMTPPDGSTSDYHVWFETSIPHNAMNAHVEPFDSYPMRQGGDSGSPNMFPMPDGSLVFLGGETTSGPSAQMQSDMDALSVSIGLNTNDYQLNRRNP